MLLPSFVVEELHQAGRTFLYCFAAVMRVGTRDAAEAPQKLLGGLGILEDGSAGIYSTQGFFIVFW
ncbi:hypothetical protein GCM10008961_38360 [Deinococcus knuensis]|uniref:Uncharacterized protein n=1 Tax=Deinococcus knuensis TaxID=1837380 RepID=A0ABQ2T060_9DEIO|nr:hypothetical protein GCM10008961_38360 [Deinococcus knuensis]